MNAYAADPSATLSVQDALHADRQLAEQIQGGDQKAFMRLYERSAKSLLHRLTRMTGSVDHAEDCLQQVFAEALRNIDRYRGEGRLDAWLERIATHTVMGWYRHKYRWRAFVDDLTEAWTHTPQATPDPLPEELFLHEEMKDMVWTLLDRLSPRKRMALLLCDLEGHTIEDAAQHMEIPVGTAASRLYHARQDFRKVALAEFRRQGLSVGDLFE